MSLPPPPSPLSVNPLDALRQAALQSRRKKAQAVEVSTPVAAPPVPAPAVVPNTPTAVDPTPTAPTPRASDDLPRDVKRSRAEREEGEISDEDEPPPAKAPRMNAPLPRHLMRSVPVPRGGRDAQAEEHPGIISAALPALASTAPLSASSTISASPVTPSFASMQAHPALQSIPEILSGAPWTAAELEEVQRLVPPLVGAGVTADAFLSNGISREFIQHALPLLNVPVPPSFFTPTARPTAPPASSQQPQIPIPIPFSNSDIPGQMLNPNGTPMLNAFGIPAWTTSFADSPFAGIPGLTASASTTPTQETLAVQPSNTDMDRLRQKEEFARRAALATKKLKAEKAAAAARLAAPPAAESSDAAATERPGAVGNFLEDFDALLAEVDVDVPDMKVEDYEPTVKVEDSKLTVKLEDEKPTLQVETGEGPIVPSPALTNYTYDMDLADEQEIENAMFAADDEADDMDVEEESLPEPILATPTAPTPTSDEAPFTNGDLGLAPPLTATASESTSVFTTPGDVTPVLPIATILPERPNGRAVVADLDAQPLSRPEQAPVLTRAYNSFRRSYHHHRHEEFRPLVIDISDSEDDDVDDEDPSASRSPEVPPLPSSSVVQAELAAAHAEAEAARIAAQRRLAEIEAEQAKYARIMARLEEKARKGALAKSAVTSGRSTPLSFDAMDSGLDRPAAQTPAVIKTTTGSTGPSAGTMELAQPGSSNPDIEMKDAASERLLDILHGSAVEEARPVGPDAQDLTVMVDAPLKGLEGAQHSESMAEYMQESTISQDAMQVVEQMPQRTYRFFKPYVSVFDEYPLLRSHSPPHISGTDIQAISSMPSNNAPALWSIRKEAAAAASELNPSARLCQFETSGGRCRDDACPDTHTKDWLFSHSSLAALMASLYPSASQQQFEQALSKVRLDHPFIRISSLATLTLAALPLAS